MNIEDNPTQYQVADPGKLLSWTIHAMPRITQKLAVRKKRRNKRKSALLYGGFDHKKVTSRRNWSSPFIILLLNNKNCSELRTKRARFWYKLIKFRLTNPNLRKTDTTGDTIIHFTIYRSKRSSNKNMNRRPNNIFFFTLTSTRMTQKHNNAFRAGVNFISRTYRTQL